MAGGDDVLFHSAYGFASREFGYMNVTTVDQALEIVTRYFDEERLMPKTRLAIEELLSG